MQNNKNNGVRRRLNFNAVAPKKKPRKKAPTKAELIRKYIKGLAQLKNANLNPQNTVNLGRKHLLQQFDEIGYNDVLTKQSQTNLAESILVVLTYKKDVKKGDKGLVKLTINKPGIQRLYNKIGKNKKIKKDTNVKMEDIAWIAHGYVLDQQARLKQNKAKAAQNAKNDKRKEQANTAAKKKANAKVKRNKAAQNRLALLNNNARKALKNGEAKIKQLVKDFATIKKKDKQGYKKLDVLNPKLSEFYKLNRNEGLTGNERQAYKKLEKEHDDIMNTLKKQVAERHAKERELKKLREAKAKLLKNAANAQKKIKGIAKGAIQKAIAADKVRVKSVANILKLQNKIVGYQSDIRNLGNINTFDKKIKKIKILSKIKEYQRDQLSATIGTV